MWLEIAKTKGRSNIGESEGETVIKINRVIKMIGD